MCDTFIASLDHTNLSGDVEASEVLQIGPDILITKNEYSTMDTKSSTSMSNRPTSISQSPTISNSIVQEMEQLNGPAEAIRYAGFENIADYLKSNAAKVLESKTHQVAATVQLLSDNGGWGATNRLRADFLNDPISLPPNQNPVIVQLSDSYRNNKYCVGIAGDCDCNWIFDSNKHDKLPLTKESLDSCCIGDATFSHVSYAVQFVPGKKLKRKRDMLQ